MEAICHKTWDFGDGATSFLLSVLWCLPSLLPISSSLTIPTSRSEQGFLRAQHPLSHSTRPCASYGLQIVSGHTLTGTRKQIPSISHHRKWLCCPLGSGESSWITGKYDYTAGGHRDLGPFMFSPLILILFLSSWKGGLYPFSKIQAKLCHPSFAHEKATLSKARGKRGMSFASPSGSLGFCKCTLSLSVSLKCYLSILLRAAVNRARAVLHRWWEGKLHNSSCPITLLPFSLLYLITEAEINTLGQKRNEFSCF